MQNNPEGKDLRIVAKYSYTWNHKCIINKPVCVLAEVCLLYIQCISPSDKIEIHWNSDETHNVRHRSKVSKNH